MLPKPSLKIGSVNKLFCFDIDNGLKHFFFRNKKFLVFQDRKVKLSESGWKKISLNLTKFKLNPTTHRNNKNNYCLNKVNELKFCEVSWNSISNRYWKFQLSILKNKKVFFLKKISCNAKIDDVSRPNFQWRFWMLLQK